AGLSEAGSLLCDRCSSRRIRKVSDEPFAALDQPTRRRLVLEFAAVLRTQRMATVFVTHDLAEASELCDRCLILDAGVILQEGSPKEVVDRPQTARIAEIVGSEYVSNDAAPGVDTTLGRDS